MIVIAFEGVDGSGKTSTIDYLQRIRSGTIIRSSEFFPAIRNFVDANLQNSIARTVYYLASVKVANLMIQNIETKKPEEIVFLDRYWYSTLASHLAYDTLYNNGNNSQKIKSLVYAAKEEFVKPDIAVFLHTESNTRKLRTVLRGSNTVGDKHNYVNNDKLFDMYGKEFQNIARLLRREDTCVVEFDTTKKSQAEIADKVNKLISQVKLRKDKRMRLHG